MFFCFDELSWDEDHFTPPFLRREDYCLIGGSAIRCDDAVICNGIFWWNFIPLLCISKERACLASGCLFMVLFTVFLMKLRRFLSFYKNAVHYCTYATPTWSK